MTDKYITLQTQLLDLQPDLSIAEPQRPANGKGRPRNVPQKPVDPQVARLLRRLERLKADILFDQDAADQKWIEKRNQLAKAAAERRRLHLDDKPQSETKSPDHVACSVAVPPAVDKAERDSAVEDDGEALGDFFSGLPDFADSSNNGVVNQQATNPSYGPITVRDFGKWNGVNPRRTFEETCKARYEAVSSVIFKIMYMYRQVLTYQQGTPLFESHTNCWIDHLSPNSIRSPCDGLATSLYLCQHRVSQSYVRQIGATLESKCIKRLRLLLHNPRHTSPLRHYSCCSPRRLKKKKRPSGYRRYGKICGCS